MQSGIAVSAVAMSRAMNKIPCQILESILCKIRAPDTNPLRYNCSWCVRLSPSLRSKFKITRNSKRYPHALVSTMYDCHKQAVVDSQVFVSHNEREAFLSRFVSHGDLFVFDRGYYSKKPALKIHNTGSFSFLGLRSPYETFLRTQDGIYTTMIPSRTMSSPTSR